MRSARVWNTRASVNIPAPAISHAMTAPMMPVAPPKVRGREKMPAPIIDPTTIPVRASKPSFFSALLFMVHLR
ncbi:hypothetical protein D3C85_1613490 [compost metagenome]